MAPTYNVVKGPVDFRNQTYGPGDIVVLPERIAEFYLKAGMIEERAEPETVHKPGDTGVKK